MKWKNKLSCVILCCDSHIDKGFSVKHCLLMLSRQTIADSDCEIIVVENSHSEDKRGELRDFVAAINSKRPGFVRLIDNDHSLPRAEARNYGASLAQNEVLVFFDDDAIVLDREALEKIQGYSEEFDHGYGAKRLWTTGQWFQDNSGSLLDEVDCESVIQENSQFRDEFHLSRSFIGHFGFCHKASFDKVGGFYQFPDYGFEDDALMFRLYMNDPKVKPLDDIMMTHVNHEVARAGEPNNRKYSEMLQREKIYWFHSLKLMQGITDREEIMEKLEAVHFNDDIAVAYELYKKSTPLDLAHCGVDKVQFWQENYRYSLLDFSRRIRSLLAQPSIDAFVKNSEGDFDNLAPVISAAVESKIISISPEGRIIPGGVLAMQKDNFSKNHLASLPPDAEINQFPCDLHSRMKRVQFIREQYPFVEHLRMGFIGDDDLVSASMASQEWITPVVVEKDSRIVAAIKDRNPRAELHTADIRDLGACVTDKVGTFLVDPPYTVDGSLGFIISGLQITEFDGKAEREFYVVLNPTMMGTGLSKVFSALSSADIQLVDVHKNFSVYKLPRNFAERERAQDFLSAFGVASNSIKYSSASNLYVFRAKNPDMDKLCKTVNWNNIYQHYGA